MHQSPKTVFITGTDSGIGKACVEFFLAKGWNVISCRHEEGLASEAQHSQLLELRVDITNTESIRAAYEQSLQKFGHVDVLINNAGYGLYGPVEALTEAQFRQQFEVNVFGTVAVTKMFIPHFRQRRQGTIVNVASMVGRLSIPHFSAYAASKWAVEGFSESLTYELAPFNIKVKIIEPGTIATNFFTSSLVTAPEAATAPYQPGASRTLGTLVAKGEKGGSPRETAQVIFNAATSNTNRLRYRQEWNAHFLLTLRSLVPNRFFRFIMKKAVG